MKIALVFDGLITGGVERVGTDYAKLLCELGHEVTVINLCPKLDEMKDEFPNECRYKKVIFPRKFAPEQYAKLVKLNTIGRFIYPIIYLFLTILNVFYKFFCRFYFNLREEYDISIAFSGHFNDLTFVASNFVKSRRKMCWLHGALYGYILISDGFLNLYKKIKNLVVLVDDAQEEVLCYNKNLNLSIYKMYNPTYIKNKEINSDMIKSLKDKYGNFMLMVSRFDYPHKDHYTVINSFEIIRKKYKKDINLVLVGSGPEEERVKEYTNSLGDEISKYVHFVGNQREVQNYFKAAHILVHASVAGEGLPTVMLEALASELPMVVTDSKVGPREILKDNEYGLLCNVQDPSDMACKINHILNDKSLYDKYKVKGRERIKDFEPEKIKKQLDDVLKKVMD